MGDRVIILVKSKNDAPICGVYLHWGGGRAKEIIRKAAPIMRAGDVGYATARLIGTCHNEIPGALSVGVLQPPADLKPETLRSYSHGDAGVFVVDLDTGEVEVHGGYGRPFSGLKFCHE